MALHLRQNFISVQYLENKWTEFHQILNMHSYWQDLHWDCNTLFFAHLYQSYGPWFRPKFPFPSLSWEQMDRISPNFIYAFILTKSLLGLLHIIFFTFVPELWPLIYAIILYPFNILRTNGQNFTKFYTCVHIDKIYVGIVTHHFLHICTSVTALDLRKNFVLVQYLENKWTEFYQNLYMHSYWQDLHLDCYTSFFAHSYQGFKPKFCFLSISWEQNEMKPLKIFLSETTRSSALIFGM